MNDYDRQKFDISWRMMAFRFHVKQQEEMIGIDWKAMQDVSIEQFSEAVQWALQSCERFPTVAQLRQHMFSYKPEKESSKIDYGSIPGIECKDCNGEGLLSIWLYPDFNPQNKNEFGTYQANSPKWIYPFSSLERPDDLNTYRTAARCHCEAGQLRRRDFPNWKVFQEVAVPL